MQGPHIEKLWTPLVERKCRKYPCSLAGERDLPGFLNKRRGVSFKFPLGRVDLEGRPEHAYLSCQIAP
ncbi:hypothetical protein CEXT_358641 [Caerostris extrusa]|uniref:Uncharacterized protein n=1 Tax=Caerostris extrusa TaxID=172846 RepID=A0AAV4QKB4_CAEEX|nr:hypothetical protein CEXT_358641 [Caerostris extrusa]